MKILLVIIASLFMLAASAKNALAVYDPLSVPNNKFGIHIFSEKDIPDAANLVNSAGGDWGYVTVVITQNERERGRWQKVFDDMRRAHLIPIVRMASKAEGDTWQIPSPDEIDGWVAFLNSLNWVTENRYVVVGNEPNHAKEWGGTLDPAGYANYLTSVSQKLKAASGDFFVLPAGFDASAKNSRDTMDEAKFIRVMLKASPSVFDGIDGWTSHSYPNPDFSGSPTDTGRGTVGTFDWELALISGLGVTKNLPVFITETGWSNQSLTNEQISADLKTAYNGIWADKRVVAVTPFILNYPDAPFAQFSWKRADGSFYGYYSDTEKLTKVKGEPLQIEAGTILAAFIQPVMPTGSDFVGAILARNTGQSIWDANNILIGSDTNNLSVSNISFNNIEPTTLGLIIFKAQAPQNPGIYGGSLFLKGSKSQRITGSFLFEGGVINIDQVQLNSIFDKIGSSLKSILHI